MFINTDHSLKLQSARGDVSVQNEARGTLSPAYSLHHKAEVVYCFMADSLYREKAG